MKQGFFGGTFVCVRDYGDNLRAMGLGAHGQNVAEAVERGDLAKKEGIVEKGGEKIDGLNDARFFRD